MKHLHVTFQYSFFDVLVKFRIDFSYVTGAILVRKTGSGHHDSYK